MKTKNIKPPIPTKSCYHKLEKQPNPLKGRDITTPDLTIPANWLLELGFEPGATVKITAGEKYLSIEQIEKPAKGKGKRQQPKNC